MNYESVLRALTKCQTIEKALPAREGACTQSLSNAMQALGSALLRREMGAALRGDDIDTLREHVYSEQEDALDLEAMTAAMSTVRADLESKRCHLEQQQRDQEPALDMAALHLAYSDRKIDLKEAMLTIYKQQGENEVIAVAHSLMREARQINQQEDCKRFLDYFPWFSPLMMQKVMH